MSENTCKAPDQYTTGGTTKEFFFLFLDYSSFSCDICLFLKYDLSIMDLYK